MKARRPAAILLGAIALAACSRGGPAPGGRLVAVATVSPITNIVQNVGGDAVRAIGLVPEGTNSHEYSPTPSDARAASEGDVFFVNGLNLELPTIELIQARKRAAAEIVRLGELTIGEDEYIFDSSFPRAKGDPNPHLWTNPLYARRYAEIVRDTLGRLDPGNAGVYRRNFDAFAARLEALDRAVRAATATVPAARRTLLTYHDSFPYFARAYGWRVVGAIQPSDFSEPAPRDVARIIAQIRRERVPAIFGSEVFESRVLRQIARETGARYVDDLRDDDLPGAPGDARHSYLGLMVFDFRTMVEALGGDASALDAVETGNVAGDASATYRE